jgi:alginate O-acetyltransferase complex protein AlgI
MTFLSIFLPLVLGLYFLARMKYRNYILLAASLIFYAWGGLNLLPIMLAVIAVNYVGAVAIDRWPARKKPIAAVTILATLGFLAYYKYAGFIASNLGFNIGKIILPIGISFYVFQALSYLIDVYRGEVCAQKNPAKLALYISLFPQLIAGPIVKYHDVDEQIDSRKITFDDFSAGVKRFIVGLGKKVLIANSCGIVADAVFGQPVVEFGAGIAWLGAVAYSLQLFFDFSGYSDMAIGLGRMFGFRFLENFNYPYISRSITEFWRRWHMSLSSWFRDYLYIPLGGNRRGRGRTYFNLAVVFLATGAWHGAAWTFVVWGIWHGIFIILECMTGAAKSENKIAFRHISTMLAVIIGWVIFRAPNLKYAGKYILKMFGFGHTDAIYKLPYYIDVIPTIAIAAGILCSIGIFRNMLGRANRPLVNVWLAAVLILSMSSIAASGYNPFIYFQF